MRILSCRSCGFRLFFACLLVGVVFGWSGVCWGQGEGVIPEEFKILASDGRMAEYFGSAMAIDQNTVAVGVPAGRNDSFVQCGAAYLFDASTGVELVKLLPKNGREFDRFGAAIALSDEVVAVGSPWNGNANGDDAGTVYLFAAASGDLIRKILPDDGEKGDWFGWSVAIDHGIVAVGAKLDGDNGRNSGSAYLFDAASGTQLAKLLPQNGAADDYFGDRIAMSDGVVAVGAVGDDENGGGAGAVYLFDAATGDQLFKLLPNDGKTAQHFGSSVAMNGGVVVVGAIGDDENGVWSGAAYLFNASTGEELLKLQPKDGVELERFGISVAINGDMVVVGGESSRDFPPPPAIPVSLFDVSTGDLMGRFLASDAASGDQFGIALAIENDVIVAGAPGDDDRGGGSGSGYVFDADAVASCLQLTVPKLFAYGNYWFTLTGGTPGSKAITVYGGKAGESVVRGSRSYCATFGIKDVMPKKIVEGYGSNIFDANGEIRKLVFIPKGAAGKDLYFQSAERGTCPDECVSNLARAHVNR